MASAVHSVCFSSGSALDICGRKKRWGELKETHSETSQTILGSLLNTDITVIKNAMNSHNSQVRSTRWDDMGDMSLQPGREILIN